MPLQLQNRWREDTHHYVRWSHDSREVIRLYKPRLQQQLVLSPRCGHLKGNGGVKGAVRFAQRLTNQYAYVARFDIRHYYESIDHRVMLAQCRHVSPDVFEPSAVLAGYDWGGRAACVVAALWPERCQALVSFNSYNIQNIATALKPDTPSNEHRLWYQYYFHSERGRAGLANDRRGLIELMWRLWSPTWSFDASTFLRTAPAFDNPDFVDVVIHSYRHRFGLVAGDPAYAAIEARLAESPVITVPTITFDGGDDGVRSPSSPAAHAQRFSGKREHRVVPGVGHNMPQEVPNVFANAILELMKH